MSVTLPSASKELKARYWGVDAPISAGDTDLEGGHKGLVQEAHFAYSECVSGVVSMGTEDGSIWVSTSSSVTFQTTGEAPLLLGAGVRRVTLFVHGTDATIRLDTSLGNSSTANISGTGTGSVTYTRGSPYTETEIQVAMSMRYRGAGGGQGEVYNAVIFAEPLTSGELP